MVYCQLWMLIIDNVSTCFGHLYAHLQEQRPRVTAYGVYLLVMLDVAGCGAATSNITSKYTSYAVTRGLCS